MRDVIRRTLVAGLLGVATFGGMAMALTATSGATPSTEQIWIPFPHEGDRGTYQWSPRAGLGFRPGLDFEWVGPNAFQGAHGAQVAQAVRVAGMHGRYSYGLGDDGIQPAPFSGVYSFDQHDMLGVEWKEFLNGTVAPPIEREVRLEDDTQQMVETTLLYGVAEAHCLLRSPLQGGFLATDAAWSRSACDLDGVTSFDGRAMTWSPAGVESVAGLEAAHLHGEGQAGTRDSVTQLDVWLASDIAYPLRVSWNGLTAGALDLVAFQPGNGPIATNATYVPTLATPSLDLHQAPRPLSFLDDRGVGHPLPLSEAIRQAVDDPKSNRLRQFLHDEPGAYIYFADGRSSGNDQYWDVSFRGHASSIRVVVWRGIPDNPLLSVPALGFDDQYPVVANVGYPTQVLPLGTVDPSLVPANVPTVAALLQAWNVAKDPSWPAQADAHLTPTWGFAFGCLDPEDVHFNYVRVTITPSPQEPCMPSLWTWAGYHADTTATSPGVASKAPFVPTSQRLLFAHDGGAVASFEVDQNQGAKPALPVNVTVNKPAGHAGVHARTDGLLSPPAAASAGTAAALVAVAYWVWPHLKSAAAGLFSRIQTPDLLQHPKRAMLLQAITAAPGTRFRELARATKMPNGSLIHHLRKLEEAGVIRALRDRKYVAYVATGAALPLEQSRFLESDSAQRLLWVIAAHPGLSLTEASDCLGLSPATVHYHVQRLADANFVVIERAGRKTRLIPGATVLPPMPQPTVFGPLEKDLAAPSSDYLAGRLRA